MKYKAIRSVTRNFAASFTSSVNWVEDDYAMSHLARNVVATQLNEFTLDLLTGEAGPAPLVTSAIAASAADGVRHLKDICARERIEVDHLVGARLRIQFTLEGTAAARGSRPPWTLPLKCTVIVTDDRGKSHESCVEAAWHVPTSHPVVGYRS